tara:strand:+ start:4948 stop:5610 length:663 start_codon:yes stop_codon:yes gene_type:complete
MKKLLKNWNNFLKENKEKDTILDKVRDIFFGAYNTWDEEYKMLQDEEFLSLFGDLKSTAKEKFTKPEKLDKVIGGAAIGLSLYWSSNAAHGAGSDEAVSFIINRKFDILESRLSKSEKEQLKTGLMKSVIDSVSKDRSNQMYPTTLAVSVGVINGVQVNDAYMTTNEAMRKFIRPLLKSKGYYVESDKVPAVPPEKTKRKEYEPEMSLADMKAMMDKFGR